MSTVIDYTKQHTGWLHLPSGEIAPFTRQRESDNGEGTALRIVKEKDSVVVSIVQYNEQAEEVFTSKKCVFPFSSKVTIVSKFQHDCWRMAGDNNVELQIFKNSSGDFELSIIGPHELASRVPAFTQVASGGKSNALKSRLVDIVHEFNVNEYLVSKQGNGNYCQHIICWYEAMME